MFTIIIGITILGLILFLIKYYIDHLNEISKHKKIPGNTYLTVLTLPSSEIHFKNPREQKKNYEKFGGLYKVVIGTRTLIHVADANYFKQIFVKEFKKLGKPRADIPDRKKIFKKQHLFILDPNDTWKKHRTLLSPGFSDNSLKEEFIGSMHKITDDLVNKWNKEITEGKGKSVLNISNDMAKLSLDIIGYSGFGKEFKSLELNTSKYSDIAARIFTALTGKLLKTNTKEIEKQFEKDSVEWVGILKKIIEERKEEIKYCEDNNKEFKKTDLLSRMMKATDEENSKFDDEELIANTHLFLLAGHETTANSLRWGFHFLATHQDVQDKLREEAKLLKSGEVLSYEDYKKGFNYTKAFVKETLRLKTPAPFVARVLLENMKLVNEKGESVKLLKGAMLFCHFHLLNVDKKYWGEDAEKFKPERFLGDKKVSATVFTPFSYGPRSCIGKSFAEMEITLTLLKAVKNFKFSLVKGHEEVHEKMKFTLTQLEDVMVLAEKVK